MSRRTVIKIAGRYLLALTMYFVSGLVLAQTAWDLDAVLADSTIFDEANQVTKRDALEIEGIRLSPVEGEVLAFTQRRKIAILSKPLQSSGYFLLDEDKGACWAIARPFPALMIITKEAIIQRNRDGSEQVMSTDKNPVVRELASLFSSVFTGDVSDILLSFDVYLLRDGMPKAGWVVGMKPKGKNQYGKPKEIRLIGDSTLRWVTFVNQSGDQTVIEFSAANDQPFDVSARCFKG